MFTDYDGDGRPDLYVANDEDPNQLYENVGWPGGARADPAGLGFRFEERGSAEGVADPYAGMGIAAGDYDGDGRPDLIVTNSRREPHAAFARLGGSRRRRFATRARSSAPRSRRARPAGERRGPISPSTDGRSSRSRTAPIPVTNLAHDAGRLQIVENVARSGARPRFANVGVLGGPAGGPRVNGRGLAAADYDNNGTVDLAVGSIGGRLALLRNTGERGHWLEVSLPTFAPGAVVTAELPDGRGSCRSCTPGAATSPPRTRASISGSARRRASAALEIRFPDGTTTRLSNVAADRVVVVKEPPAPATRDDTAPSSYLARRLPLDPRARIARSLASGTRRAAGVLGSSPPPEQARDLFHLSAAMWDAWAAYDPKADGYFLDGEASTPPTSLAARSAAISFAAYRLLLWRALVRPNVRASFARLTRPCARCATGRVSRHAVETARPRSATASLRP